MRGLQSPGAIRGRHETVEEHAGPAQPLPFEFLAQAVEQRRAPLDREQRIVRTGLETRRQRCRIEVLQRGRFGTQRLARTAGEEACREHVE